MSEVLLSEEWDLLSFFKSLLSFCFLGASKKSLKRPSRVIPALLLGCVYLSKEILHSSLLLFHFHFPLALSFIIFLFHSMSYIYIVILSRFPPFIPSILKSYQRSSQNKNPYSANTNNSPLTPKASKKPSKKYPTNTTTTPFGLSILPPPKHLFVST